MSVLFFKNLDFINGAEDMVGKLEYKNVGEKGRERAVQQRCGLWPLVAEQKRKRKGRRMTAEPVLRRAVRKRKEESR